MDGAFVVEAFGALYETFEPDVAEEMLDGDKQKPGKPTAPRVTEPVVEEGALTVEEQIAIDNYERFRSIQCFAWDDVSALRNLSHTGAPELRDFYDNYAEEFRRLAYSLDAVDAETQRYIEQFGYPANMTEDRLQGFMRQYAFLDSNLRSVAGGDPAFWQNINRTPHCRYSMD